MGRRRTVYFTPKGRPPRQVSHTARQAADKLFAAGAKSKPPFNPALPLKTPPKPRSSSKT